MRGLARLLLVGVALVCAAPAGAQTGVSIDVGRIAVSDELAPGGEYRLPTFGVRNPGTDTTSYRITVSYLEGQQEAQPPEAWFSFSPAEMSLAGGQSQPVQTRLTIPPDAVAGEYHALVGPQIVGSGGGAQVGAAAAARLTFTVGPCEGFDCWLRWLWRFIQENPWVLIIPALVLGLLTLLYLRRRFSFSVSRRAD
jgi:hypothetical protein